MCQYSVVLCNLTPRWYYVFIISNFTYIQAFLHCLFTGNKTNECVCLTLASLVVCLESLHVQGPIVLAPGAIVAPGMHEDIVIFEPLSQI